MAAVLDYARLQGVVVRPLQARVDADGRWVTAMQGAGVGFPDLLLVKGPRLLAVELKVGKNKLTQEQFVGCPPFDGGRGNARLVSGTLAEIEALLGA
jgi:hypothetical protein